MVLFSLFKIFQALQPSSSGLLQNESPRRSPRLAKKRKLDVLSTPSSGPFPNKVQLRTSCLLNAVISRLQHPDFASKYTYKLLYANDYEGECLVEITRRMPDISAENGGPHILARVVVHADGRNFFNILGETQREDQLPLSETTDMGEQLKSILSKLDEKWVFCGGITEAEYEEESSNLRYEPKCEKTTFPYNSVHSQNCTKWFHCSHPKKQKKNDLGYFVCAGCSQFLRHVRKLNAKNDITDSEKKRRQQPSSHYKLNLLSPASCKIRQRNVRKKRQSDKKKIQRLQKRVEKLKIELNDEQDKEMKDIVSIINKKYESEVQSVLEEASEQSSETGAIMRDIWEQDTKDREDFVKDQIRNKTGSKANVWSSITYRVALAIFTRSPSAFESLKSFKILQLPSTESLKRIASSCLHDPGINEGIETYIEDQSSKYAAYKEEMLKRDKPEPLGEGVLIFDEVKVIARVKWSSRGRKFFGLEMDPFDYLYLNDIYETLDPNLAPQPAQYMLQFLWRDVSSDFDVVGPYFAVARSIEHRFIIACVTQSMRVFHAYGFQVVGIVCDGASSNLAAIKMLCTGRRGTFGKKEHVQPGEDKHEIKAWFTNPFQPALKVFCCICPSHQVILHN